MVKAGASRERLLIVEDEEDLAESLAYALERDGFAVHTVGTGEAALEALGRQAPELVLLDLMLPDMSGLEVLKQIKRSERLAATRVIIVTARKDEIDRVLGFELGADDYVTKPFSPREVVLRARAVLQRAAPAPERPSNVLRTGPIEIDLELHEARVGGRSIQLTLTEFRLLSELVHAGGHVRSRETLLSRVWGYDSEVMSRTVDTHVRRLRNKLGGAADWLVTVRGIGYRIQEPAGGAEAHTR